MPKIQISPKAQIVLGIIVALLYYAAHGSVALPLGVPPDWGAYITSWASFLIGIYLALQPFLPAFASSAPGPLAPPDSLVVVAAQKVADASATGSPSQVKVAKDQLAAAVQAHAGAFLAFLMASCLIMMLAPGVARAQAQVAAGESPIEFNTRTHATKAAPASPSSTNAASPQPAAPSTGVPCNDIINLLPLGCTPTNGGSPSPLSGPLQDIINFFSSDFDAAATLAVQIPALQDGNGQACWTQASSVSALLKIHPLPVTFKLATDFEALRLLNMSVNNMCANPACTQMFTDLSNGISQLGLNVPIPSLTVLCSKFPTIVKGAVAAPAASTTVLIPAPAK